MVKTFTTDLFFQSLNFQVKINHYSWRRFGDSEWKDFLFDVAIGAALSKVVEDFYDMIIEVDVGELAGRKVNAYFADLAALTKTRMSI
jgi:hypothetical protein